MKDIKEEKTEVKKLSAKRWISYFLLAVCIIIVYKYLTILEMYKNGLEHFLKY